MKFTVKREKLQKALQRVGSIIGARSMLPLLGNVLIEAGENNLKLCTTDLDIRITTSVEADDDDDLFGDDDDDDDDTTEAIAAPEDEE